ncbi:alpha/beta-hydrolase [Aspergillus keveii]|uniref:Alpha/beta-hydrolase n=1 Tax=Aspergillus keveii TaxID=714993 RepID=A0ABR4FRS9_9EURO
MVKLWKLLLQKPLKSCRFLYAIGAQILLVGLKAILLPSLPRYQSIRLQLHRAYWSSSSYYFPEVIHRLPVTNCPETRAHRVGSEFTGYVIPGTAELAVAPEDRRRCVIIYAHGGGYARGEARMYLNYMEEWVKGAAEVGLDLVFLSVEYPLTHEAPQPAQQEAFLSAYRYVLDIGISSRNVIFMGDSAGGGLCVLSLLNANRTTLPQPAGSVLVSPWLDMSLPSFRGGNALVETDYLVGGNLTVPTFVNAWLNGEPGDSPQVNPLYCALSEFEGVNPVLILVGGGEFALQEGKDLARHLEDAGVRQHLEVEWGQMHLYALGSKWVDPEVRRKTDAMIYRWILECLAGE